MAADPKIPTEPCTHCRGTGLVPSTALGPRLKTLRKAHGLRLVDVAAYLEIDHQRVADYESGRRHISPELAEAWLGMYERMHRK